MLAWRNATWKILFVFHHETLNTSTKATITQNRYYMLRNFGTDATWMDETKCMPYIKGNSDEIMTAFLSE